MTEPNAGPAGHAPESQAPFRIDIRHAIGMVRSYWWLVTALFVLSLVAAAILYARADRIYVAGGRVAVDRQATELVTVEDTQATLTADSAQVDTEVQRLASASLAEAVVRKLHLQSSPDFAGRATGEAAVTAATQKLIQNLTVKREGTSFAISINYKSDDAETPARIVNTLIDLYRSGQVATLNKDRGQQVAWLNTRLEKLRSDMVSAEQAVADFRVRNGIIDADKNSTIQQQEISALNTELAKSRADQAYAQSRLSAADGGASAMNEALNSSVVSELRRQQAQLSVEKADLAKRYGPLHPDLQRIDRQIAEIGSRINSEIGRIRSSIRTEAHSASQRTNSIQSSINRAAGTVMNQTEASVRLNELERNAQSAQQLYQTFLDQYRTAVAKFGGEQSNISVISYASPPTAPTWPNLPVFGLAALAGGAVLSALALSVIYLLRNGLETKAEVERNLGVRLIASIPDLRAILPASERKGADLVHPSAYLIDHPGSAYANAIRGLRMALQQPRDQGQIKVVAISSSLPDEGKTTLSMSLARSAALSGQRVLLIDTDLRRRVTSQTMAASVKTGIVEVLMGKAKLEEAIVEDSRTGLFLLPQSAATSDQYEAISTESFGKLLDQLRDSFDFIVMDTAPTLAVAESRIVAACADAAVLAIRWRKTPVKAADMTLDKLDQYGTNVIGAVFTLVDVRQQIRAGFEEGEFYQHYKHYYTN